MKQYLRRLVAAATMAAVLTACGGGGGGGEEAFEADAPQAVALLSGDIRTDGSELRAHVGGTVRLDARDVSQADAVAFGWKLTARPAGSKLVVSGQSAVLAWKPDVVGRYVFTLAAADANGGASTRTIVVHVDNRPPPATLLVSAAFTPKPTTVAPRSVSIGAEVVVDATRTKDPDGQPVTIKFELLTRPKASKAALSVAGRAARFKPDVAGSYRLSVRGTDPMGAGFETVYTFVADNRGPNPVLVATVDATIGKPGTRTVQASVGYDVLLDSARSSDPDGNKLTRAWQIVSRPAGSGAQLTSKTGTATVLSPDAVGKFVVRLTVTDSRGARSVFDTTVQVDNRRPVAQVGTNATPDSLPSAPGVHVPLGTELRLRGDASEDADGDALSYAWTVDARPAGSTARPSSATDASPLFTPDKEGTYRLRLRVTDTAGAFSERTLTLRVGTHDPVAIVDRVQFTGLVGETVRASAALSFDEDGDALAYAWSVDARPVDSTATLAVADAAAVSFVPDLPGIYVLAVRVSDGESASFAYVTVRVLAQVDNQVDLGFAPAFAHYSLGLDKLVLTATGLPHALRAVDPFSGTIATTVLPGAVKNFSLSPNGKLAVVLHEGAFSLVDVETSTVLRSTASLGSQTDAFVTDAGMVYLIGASGGQWVTPGVTVFNGRTGVRVAQNASAPGNGYFYGSQVGVQAGSLDKVFFVAQGLSPSDISYFSFQRATSLVTRSGDSPYHGDYEIYAPLFLSSDETLLFTVYGTYFSTADLSYAGRLAGVTAMAGFSHSAARQEAVVLQGGPGLPSAYKRFSGPLLFPDVDLPLPLVGGRQSYGSRIFHSANGSHVVLVQTGTAQANGPGAAHHVIVR